LKSAARRSPQPGADEKKKNPRTNEERRTAKRKDDCVAPISPRNILVATFSFRLTENSGASLREPRDRS